MALVLGPIVGHTDARSTRVWIQVDDDPSIYALRIPGVGVFPFVGTEERVELGTAVAIAQGLLPDRPYRYYLLRRDRLVDARLRSFRTMPRDDDPRGISFATISCNSNTELGSWPDLLRYVRTGAAPVPSHGLRTEQPRFLLMVGDQVYADQHTHDEAEADDAWEGYFEASSEERRRAIARWYRASWGRDLLRQVMASIPTYMMWDDHDIRNGWGSLAHDSPTIAARYPDMAHLQRAYNEVFEDFRYVCWHFQRSHGPPPGATMPLVAGQRRAMPAIFRVAGVLVLMLDSRGERDVFRKEADRPALGVEQWAFIDDVLGDPPAEVHTLVITTAAPIAHYSKSGIAQHRVAGYPAQTTYDVRAFRGGRYVGGDGELWGAGLVPRNLRPPLKPLRRAILEVRDQWPHHRTRAEQEDLIRAGARAQFANRRGRPRRDLIFVGGDVHFGGDYRITVRKPASGQRKTELRCFFSSGIGKKISDDDLEGKAQRSVKHRFRTRGSFQVARGIRSKLKRTEWRMNLGVVQTRGLRRGRLRTSVQSTQPYSSDRSVARKQKRN